MSPERIFIVDGRLRPIWRCFLSVVLLFLAFVLTAEAVGLTFRALHIQPQPIVISIWGSMVGLAAILGAYKLMTAVFDRRPLGSVGLTFHHGWGIELGYGLTLGAAMILTVALLERVCGFVQFTYAPHPMLKAASLSFLLFAAGAINEEAIFRGYPFQRLVEAITPVGAIAVTSALFGAAHLANPHRTWVSTLNTALVGIPFAIAYLRTRSLWMPIGMHFIWNFLLGCLLGLPVSGINLPESIFKASVHGGAWWTGAAYGPEGGLLATMVIVLATVCVLFSKRIYVSEEMRGLVFGPLPSREPEGPLTLFTAPAEESKRV